MGYVYEYWMLNEINELLTKHRFSCFDDIQHLVFLIFNSIPTKPEISDEILHTMFLGNLNTSHPLYLPLL